MALKNYVLGRGEVFIAAVDAATKQPGLFRYVGNSTELNLTAETEDLEHTNSDEGVNEVDDQVQLGVTRSGTLTLDDIQRENLALFFFGSTGVRAQAAAVDQSETHDDGAGEFVERTVFLGVTPSNPVGQRNVGDPTTGMYMNAEDAGGAAVNLAVGTDYVRDDKRGSVTFRDTALVRSVAEVTINYDREADATEQVVSGGTPFEAALKFIENNPKGENNDWTLPLIQISPNGDLALKGDEWRNIPFSLSVQKPANAQAIYVNGVPA